MLHASLPSHHSNMVEEQPIRIGWWSTFLGIANSFGGLLAFAIGHIDGSLASYLYVFQLG
jgi:hypothetical protein